MDKTQQRIAIAEACGWKRWDHPDALKRKEGWIMPENFVEDPEGFQVSRHSVPDYLNDLNAMHEAEKVLDWDQKYDYGEALARMTIGDEFDDPEGFTPNGLGYFAPITASAAQRAEAFLRTLGKWEETITRKET
jgi:hypothetical protein